MMRTDQGQKLWYGCGKMRFSDLVFRDKKVQRPPCLGCKRSQVQILSRRPSYLSKITKHFRYKSSLFFKALIVIIDRKYDSLTTEIVVNCGRHFLSDQMPKDRASKTTFDGSLPRRIPSLSSAPISQNLKSYIQTTSRHDSRGTQWQSDDSLTSQNGETNGSGHFRKRPSLHGFIFAMNAISVGSGKLTTDSRLFNWISL